MKPGLVLAIPLSCVFCALLPAQATAREVLDELDGRERPGVEQAARDALSRHDKLLREGEGLHYRGRIQQMAGEDWRKVLASFEAHVTAAPDSELAHESRFLAAQVCIDQARDMPRARRLLEAVDADRLGVNARRAHDVLVKRLAAEARLYELRGQEPPAFEALDVIGGAADFSLAKYRGKVVVLDFFATWCGPCRATIPELVALQEERGKDGLQVVGLTRFYGHGMDFAAGAKAPNGGTAVRGLSNDDEVKVNEAFAKAFKVNYPIVFTAPEVGSQDYGVKGIPTVFVIGRDGRIVGHVMGSGAKARIARWVDEALAERAPAPASAPAASRPGR